MYSRILFCVLIIVIFTSTVAAQDAGNRADTIANLKQQLIELEGKRAQLRMRLEELDEELKPENIEHALAGIGSTRPEELREHRKRMLKLERNGIQAQLTLIEESCARTESAITAAKSAAYLDAQASPTPSTLMTMAPIGQSSRRLLRAVFLFTALFIFAFAGRVWIWSERRVI